MRSFLALAGIGIALSGARAFGFTITPVFVNGDTQTWDANKMAVVNQAISDWEREIAFPASAPQNINITFDFTHAGTGDSAYLGYWNGNFSAFAGASLYPYSPEVTHVININADEMTPANPGDPYLAFTQGRPTADQWDALSIVTHEIGHALGFTTLYVDNFENNDNNKWEDHITLNTAAQTAVFDPGSLNVSMDSDTNDVHTLDGGSTADDLMNPFLFNGERRTFSKTDLDMLALAYGYTLLTIPGDANLDGLVNIDDFLAADDGYLNKLTGWANGDFDGNGVVNAADFAILDASYNAHKPAAFGGLSAVPVPEPTSLVVLATGAMLLRLRRR